MTIEQRLSPLTLCRSEYRYGVGASTPTLPYAPLFILFSRFLHFRLRALHIRRPPLVDIPP